MMERLPEYLTVKVPCVESILGDKLTAFAPHTTGIPSMFSEIHFRNTLEDGTPFTQRGARELRRLGIMTMVIPTGCMVLAEIGQGIMKGFMNVSIDARSDLNFDNEASVVPM